MRWHLGVLLTIFWICLRASGALAQEAPSSHGWMTPAPLFDPTPRPSQRPVALRTALPISPGASTPLLTMRTPDPMRAPLPVSGGTMETLPSPDAVSSHAPVSQIFNLVIGNTGQAVTLHVGEGQGRVEVALQPGGTVPVVPVPGVPVYVVPSQPPVAYATAPPPIYVAPMTPALPNVADAARVLGVDGGFALIAEAYAAGAVSLVPTSVGKVGFRGRADLGGDWTVGGQFDYIGYTLVDTALVGSEHHRDQFTLSFTGEKGFGLGPVRLDGGLGYWARQVSVANSLPPSLTVPFASAPSQTYHGPRLIGRASLTPTSTIRAELAVAAQPYVFAEGDPSVQALAPLFGAELAPSIAWQPFPSLVVALAYRFEVLANPGVGYNRIEQGPSFSILGKF